MKDCVIIIIIIITQYSCQNIIFKTRNATKARISITPIIVPLIIIDEFYYDFISSGCGSSYTSFRMNNAVSSERLQ